MPLWFALPQHHYYNYYYVALHLFGCPLKQCAYFSLWRYCALVMCQRNMIQFVLHLQSVVFDAAMLQRWRTTVRIKFTLVLPMTVAGMSVLNSDLQLHRLVLSIHLGTCGILLLMMHKECSMPYLLDHLYHWKFLTVLDMRMVICIG